MHFSNIASQSHSLVFSPMKVPFPLPSVSIIGFFTSDHVLPSHCLCVSIIGFNTNDGAQTETYPVTLRDNCIPTRASFAATLSSRCWNHEGRPMGLCEGAKGGIVSECDLSEIRGFHPLAQTTAIGCYNTFRDQCRGKRVLRCGNCVAQFSSDGDFVEDGSSADHRDAWNDHGVKLRLIQSCSVTIIPLKSRDGLSDDLWLGVVSADGSFILLDHQKDG
jgi:hypothetical protein